MSPTRAEMDVRIDEKQRPVAEAVSEQTGALKALTSEIRKLSEQQLRLEVQRDYDREHAAPTKERVR